MVAIDMDKPNDCTECSMCSYDDDSCLLQTKMYTDWDKQYANCPLKTNLSVRCPNCGALMRGRQK